MTSQRLSLLRDRAHMLTQVRQFFAERNVLEVDCPILSPSASVDAYIDLIPARYNNCETRYLHSSPEYGMKRLLSEGIGDIYQLSHVFRDGECGEKHNPEFMMIEWYRKGITFSELVQETGDLVKLFVGNLPSRTLSYREVFQKYADLDYVQETTQTLKQYLRNRNIHFHESAQTKDELLNVILGTVIEPHLGKDELFILAYYPASQAALAKTFWNGNEPIAERFEIYFQGLELANGYHELVDSDEQRKRFHEENEERVQLGKSPLPIDENFLDALKIGLPECCGVAVGFDRLMMLRHKRSNIADIIPFAWKHA
jgi:lysyl-tRNA synthetase class 2